MASHYIQDFLGTQTLKNSQQDSVKIEFSLQRINMHFSAKEWAVWGITSGSTTASSTTFII